MKNIDIDINIDKVILENINIDINMDFLENIDIDKGILQNINMGGLPTMFSYAAPLLLGQPIQSERLMRLQSLSLSSVGVAQEGVHLCLTCLASRFYGPGPG